MSGSPVDRRGSAGRAPERAAIPPHHQPLLPADKGPSFLPSSGGEPEPDTARSRPAGRICAQLPAAGGGGAPAEPAPGPSLQGHIRSADGGKLPEASERPAAGIKAASTARPSQAQSGAGETHAARHPEDCAMPRRARRTAPTAESLLEQVLEDAYAHLGALEGWRGSLLDAPPLLSLRGSRPGLVTKLGSSRARRECPLCLSLDLAGFSPEDVAVRLDGRRLQITAKRETENRAPDGCCSRDYREVSQEVVLPDDADLEAVSCALSDDGRLRIEAPRLPPPPPPERVVPIQRGDQPGGQEDQVQNGGEAAEGDQMEAEGGGQ